jgi:hypothetical protein
MYGGTIHDSTDELTDLLLSLNSRDHVREQLFSTTHAMITIPSSHTLDHSTLPADNETGLTSADKEISKVSGKEGQGFHPDML